MQEAGDDNIGGQARAMQEEQEPDREAGGDAEIIRESAGRRKQ